jgi:acyl-CoA reductase-like NAD-dependent aldehyde dehydrogenase
MTSVSPPPLATDDRRPTPSPVTFDSLNPATGEVIAAFAVHGTAEVHAAVERARTAAVWWAALGEPARRRRLHAWRRHLVRHADEIADLIHRENGKPLDDASLEVSVAVAHLAWAAGNARRVLGSRRVRPGILAPNHAAAVDYLPFGVVGVIGPWNYPVHTPLGSISYALSAGNAVVFKPSEYTPAAATWLVDSFRAVVDEQPVLQLVTGFADTGAALCRAGVDKVAFTGSASTGRLVLAACAETLTPCVVECGGKDAVIVAADADLDKAAEQTVWGAMSNAGQTCAGVERVYVESPVYDAFAVRVADRARTLQPGATADADYGPITMPRQVEVIRRHIEAALAAGARALVGGSDSVRPPFVDPVVLADVPADNPAVTEETFGPTVVLTRVRSLDEAVDLANSGSYGLGASVFSRHQGRQIAERLQAGMVSINSVLTYASIPGLPWGGSKESGFGRIHGADGLREFARSRAITTERLAIPLTLTSFARGERAVDQVKALVRLRWGRGRPNIRPGGGRGTSGHPM